MNSLGLENKTKDERSQNSCDSVQGLIVRGTEWLAIYAPPIG